MAMQRITIGAIARQRWIRGCGIAAAFAAVISVVIGQPSPPATPLVALAPSPLYAQGARAKPTLTLALSVEFPTVGAQYLSGVVNSADDNTYSAAQEYPGYFDVNSCYRYHDDTANASNKYFDRLLTPATGHECGGAGFSGNFMNWAGSSAIDILRYGLTGGDRIVDTPTLTVLQRAVLPNSGVSNNFWNGSNFPSKQVSGSTATGALPSALLNGYAGTVYVASCLDRIHFGTQRTGSCASPGNNSNLGVTTTGTMGPITAFNGTLPSGLTVCSGENGTCTFSGAMQVYYGANGQYKTAGATAPVSCSNNVFGDPISGTYKQCYVGPTSWVPPSSGTGALTSDGFFYDRVAVCASDTMGQLLDPRPDLCLRYPSGNFKPVGNLQKYSDRVRVAVFGYLNDNTGDPNQRYGGVLRSAMKYVGPSYYDSNFNLVSGANPNQEWDTTTGVFKANPDNNSTVHSGPGFNGPYLSGAINYLNQFGRTGTFGQYKTYDPVGELYYESVRYLQGLPPTQPAINGIDPVGNPGLQDGYPAATTWVDPHPAVAGMSNYACVRNNIVAIGDTHTWNDKSIPGNTTLSGNEGANTTTGFPFPPGRPANLAGNEPDFYSWTKVVGGFESNTPFGYTDGNGNSQTTGTPPNPNPNAGLWGLETRTNAGAEGASFLMVGVAYWANTHDIRGANWTTNWNSSVDPRRPGMRISTYVIDVNEAGDSSPYNNRHGNQFFLASKYGGFTDASGTGSPFKALDGSNNNADWQDPVNPLEANNYFLSSSASSVLNALNTIFVRIASQADSIAGGSISTQRLSGSNGFVYQAQFDASGWSGDLQANALVVSGSSVMVNPAPAWKASTVLSAADPTLRNIVIGKTTPSGTVTATDFKWGSVDPDVVTAMQTPPYAPMGSPQDSAALGQARLNYLRGDRSNEAPLGQHLRTRNSPLGDIVNSAVAFMGAPSLQISDPTYASFASSHAGRRNAVFVGANDGMLHAFDAANGNELFAFIPSSMIPSLANLTSNAYIHQSYVDGSAVVAEARLGLSSTWKTVLVGATGGGSQGVFGLDVSDPTTFGTSNVMWEFTDRDDSDMGNVIGKPQILKLRTSATGAAPVYQYFAVVASGVNNYANDAHFSTTGEPVLFFLNLGKPAGAAWTASGSSANYFKVKFPALTTMASGMVGFTATLGDGDAVSAIFAGDMQGNLWKLDFSQATAGTTDWSLAKLSYFHDSGNAPMPMYIAVGATNVRQPITMEPTLIYGANRSIIVSFGTGKFMEMADNTGPFTRQSVYAILDNGSRTPDSGTGSTSAIAGRLRLQPGTLSSGTISVAPFNWGRSLVDTSDPNNIRSGWYFDFPNQAERQVSDFTLVAGKLFFGSVIPAVNSCDDGSGNLYVTNALTGNGVAQTSTVGILGQPFVAQVGSSTIGPTDILRRGTETAQMQVILQGSSGATTTLGNNLLSPTDSRVTGRLNWREISNYQQLRQ